MHRFLWNLEHLCTVYLIQKSLEVAILEEQESGSVPQRPVQHLTKKVRI
jgi:hypothetical protein